jgi:hypothetical protein
MNGKRLTLVMAISLSLLSLWALESCNKNNSTTSYQTDGTLTASINGTAYSAKSYVVSDYINSFGSIIVQGETISGSDTVGLQVSIPYILPLDTAISVTNSAYAGYAAIAYQIPGKEYDCYFGLGASHGTITLTSADTVNHQVAGTFSGVLYNKDNATGDSVVLTNGAFNSAYQVQ